MSNTVKYDKLVEKLEESLKNKYSSQTISKTMSIGASIYELRPSKDIFGDAFELIASKPKEFRFNVISTADLDYNAIKTYLDFCEFELSKNKKYIRLKDIKEFEVDRKYKFKINNILVFLVINKQIRKKVNKEIIYTATIIYTNKIYSRVILVSIPLMGIEKNFLKFGFLTSDENTIFSSISDIIELNTRKSLTYYLNNSSKVKTNLIFFTDITNSTAFVNEYSREALFFIQKSLEKVAQEIEKTGGFIINEILGDGILYSISLLKLREHDNVEEILISLNRRIYEVYNSEKSKFLKLIEKSTLINETYVYEQITDILNKTFLKTAIAIDGTYFMPFANLSFNRSIMYGKNLWNMDEIFKVYEKEKNKSDIFIYNEVVERYLRIFCDVDFNKVSEDLKSKNIVCINDKKLNK